MGDTTALRQLG